VANREASKCTAVLVSYLDSSWVTTIRSIIIELIILKQLNQITASHHTHEQDHYRSPLITSVAQESIPQPPN
jgi:hypothetical protein